MEHDELFETLCKPAFDRIGIALERLDESIRGNGRPGMVTRLDRLEVAESKRSKLLWVIVTIVTGTLVTTLVRIITVNSALNALGGG